MTIFKRAVFKHLLLAATILASPLTVATPAAAQVAVGIALPGISVTIAPPVLPIYVQAPMPAVGYLWTPGYWSWGADQAGYYWVPGTWVQPPTVGVLWTPPYWGWNNGNYVFYNGYWGPHVGYYGGVNYGFGYGGNGYGGGRWDGDRFAYNQSVNNFGSVEVTNVYRENVTTINNSQVSYAGGTGGLRSEPTAADRVAANERHVAPTAQQTEHYSAAARNPELAASHNGGHPAIAATSQPAKFEGPGVVRAAPAGVAERAAPPAAAARPEPGHPVATNAAPAAAAGRVAPAQHAASEPHTAAAEPASIAPAHPAAMNAAPAAAQAAPVQHAAPAPAQHMAAAAPAHPEPVHTAPVHAAPVHAAPVHAAAPARAAPIQHVSAPARQAPVQHAAAPAPHAAVAPHAAPAEKRPAT